MEQQNDPKVIRLEESSASEDSFGSVLKNLENKLEAALKHLEGDQKENTAEIRAERRWEHKLMLLPIWYFALSGIALALFKLRESR